MKENYNYKTKETNEVNDLYYQIDSLSNVYIKKHIKLTEKDINELQKIPKNVKAYLIEEGDDNIFVFIESKDVYIFYSFKENWEKIKIIENLEYIYHDFDFFELLVKTLSGSFLIFWNKYEDIKKYINYIKSIDITSLSWKEFKKLINLGIWLSTIRFKTSEYMDLKDKQIAVKMITLSGIPDKIVRPIDLLLLKYNWQIQEKDYQKYLPEVKKLLKTQLTNEYYKIFLQIPNQFPFPIITQKELDFYAGKIKEYKANIPWIWQITLKLDKPIITEEEYKEYSKKLKELKEKYLWTTQQDILNLQEELKFNSMEELIQSIREHKLKEFLRIKNEYAKTKNKEELKKDILELVKKHYKEYKKLSNKEKDLVNRLIIWVEINGK